MDSCGSDVFEFIGGPCCQLRVGLGVLLCTVRHLVHSSPTNGLLNISTRFDRQSHKSQGPGFRRVTDGFIDCTWLSVQHFNFLLSSGSSLLQPDTHIQRASISVIAYTSSRTLAVKSLLRYELNCSDAGEVSPCSGDAREWDCMCCSYT
jgi:hypothetical protein